MSDASHDADVKVLHGMGYAQELSRRMGGFQNFAISFSISCILAGGIGAYTIAFSAAGGGSIGIGWIVGSVFALLVALAQERTGDWHRALQFSVRPGGHDLEGEAKQAGEDFASGLTPPVNGRAIRIS